MIKVFGTMRIIETLSLEVLGNTRIALLIGPASLLNACVPSSAHIADYGHIRRGAAVGAVVIGSCLAVGVRLIVAIVVRLAGAALHCGIFGSRAIRVGTVRVARRGV
jgi:hypothetical protein